MKIATRSLRMIGLTLAVVLTIHLAQAAQNNRKLSGTMPAFGDVSAIAPLISPDGHYVVYVADQTTDGANELWSAPLTGADAPVRVSGALPTTSTISSFIITPDSQRVIYLAPQDTPGMVELYSAPITGGLPLKLNAALSATDGVTGFEISPDGEQVVYQATQSAPGVRNLYAVPIEGGAVITLNSPLIAGGTVSFFRISADSSRVVYLADQDTDNVSELYSVPLTGGLPTKLNGALVTGGDVQCCGFTISADNARVAYLADQDSDNVIELYSAPITGGATTKLNGPLVTGGNLLSFQLSPDGSRAVYWADQDTVGVNELYSVPIVGGAAAKLNDPLANNGDVDTYAISADSGRVVYSAAQDTENVTETLQCATGWWFDDQNQRRADHGGRCLSVGHQPGQRPRGVFRQSRRRHDNGTIRSTDYGRSSRQSQWPDHRRRFDAWLPDQPEREWCGLSRHARHPCHHRIVWRRDHRRVGIQTQRCAHDRSKHDRLYSEQPERGLRRRSGYG